jgi:hypothetical protein
MSNITLEDLIATAHRYIIKHFTHNQILRSISMSSDELLANQQTILSNQETILANQEKLDRIFSNQDRILANQETILANQEKLDKIGYQVVPVSFGKKYLYGIATEFGKNSTLRFFTGAL